jgi:hypothetical protein
MPKYNRHAIMASICQQIADGRSLRWCCEQENMPDKWTVLKWLDEDAELSAQYARAREQQADHFAEELIEIVDTEPDAARARVRMDARKWIASKLQPKRYGDRVAQEITGPGGGPVQVEKVSARELLFDRIAGVSARTGTGGDPGKSD